MEDAQKEEIATVAEEMARTMYDEHTENFTKSVQIIETTMLSPTLKLCLLRLVTAPQQRNHAQTHHSC